MASGNRIPLRDAKGRIASTKGTIGKPGEGNNGTVFHNPESVAAAAGDATEPGERGARRPDTPAPGKSTPGTGTAKSGKTQSAQLDVSAWAGILQGAHALTAMGLGQQHWLINDAEAKRYGDALGKAMRHFPIVIQQKAVDCSALFCMAMAIELPRIGLSLQLRNAKKSPARSTTGPIPSAQVFTFTKTPSPTASTATTPEMAEGPMDLGGELAQ